MIGLMIMKAVVIHIINKAVGVDQGVVPVAMDGMM